METSPAPASPPPPEEDPAIIAARLRRRLFMGAALFLALLSIYGGLLGIPWGIQVALAVMAVICVVMGLRAPEGRPPTGETPRRDG